METKKKLVVLGLFYALTWMAIGVQGYVASERMFSNLERALVRK